MAQVETRTGGQRLVKGSPGCLYLLSSYPPLLKHRIPPGRIPSFDLPCPTMAASTTGMDSARYNASKRQRSPVSSTMLSSTILSHPFGSARRYTDRPVNYRPRGLPGILTLSSIESLVPTAKDYPAKRCLSPPSSDKPVNELGETSRETIHPVERPRDTDFSSSPIVTRNDNDILSHSYNVENDDVAKGIP